MAEIYSIANMVNKADRVYAAGDNPSSIFPVVDDWHKIGKSSSTAGSKNHQGDHYERTRAYNQGNCRGTIVKHCRDGLVNADAVEKKIFKELRQRGVKNLHDITGETGHGEWWNLTEEQASQIIDEIVNTIGVSKDEQKRKQDINDDIFDSLFGE